jgi:hypothetical protein
MNELINFIKDKYIENIKASVDLHKILIFMLFILALVSLSLKDSSSIWKVLGNIYISDILNTGDGFISKVRIFHLIAAFILVIVNGYSYQYLKSKTFTLFRSNKDLTEYVEKIQQKFRTESTDNDALNLYLASELKDEIGEKKSELFKIHVYGEILLSLSLISALNFLHPNLDDLFIFVILFSGFWFIQKKSFEYYLAKMVPLLIFEKVFLGKDFEFDDNFNKK